MVKGAGERRAGSPESTRKLQQAVFFPIFCHRRDVSDWPTSGQAVADSVVRAWEEKHMRYYLPLREKSVQGKKGQAPSRMLPLWVWLAAIACLLLLVLAMR
jgi:hypothetical protein